MEDFYFIVDSSTNTVLINIRDVYICADKNIGICQVFNVHTDKLIGTIKYSVYEGIMSIIQGKVRYESGTIVK